MSTTGLEPAAGSPAAGPPGVPRAPSGPSPTGPIRNGPARRRRHPARWIAGTVLVLLVAVAVVAATRPSYQASQVASPLVGQRAPAVSGTSFDGTSVSLASYRGRYVYVNFFASWCPPCVAEEPNLVAFNFEQQRSPTGARVLGVVFNDSDAAARQFVTRWGAQWPTVPDNDGATANAYGVESPPMTFLVNPSGRIVGVWAGPAKVSQLDSMLAVARHHGG